MAVQFLTGLNVNGNINLNTNQLQNAVIQPLGADPASITGRIYYNSGTNKLKIYNGTDWVSFQTGSDGDTTYSLSGVGSTNGTAGVSLVGSDSTTDNVLVIGAGTVTVTRSGDTLTVTGTDSALGTVTSVATSHAGDAFSAAIGGNASVNPSVDITMAGDATQYVNGAGNLTTFPSIPQGDITAVTVTAPITGGGTSGIVAIGHASQTDTEDTDTATLTFGGTFNAYTNVTANATGHVTQHEVTTFTLPANPNVNTTSLPVKNSAGTAQFTSTETTGIRFAASGSASVSFTSATQVVTISSTDNNETYTLPVSAGTAVSGHTVADIDLTAGGTGSGIKSRVTFAGKDENILITDTVGNNGVVKIALTDSVTVVDSLTVGQDVGVGNDLNVTGQGSFTGQVTVPTANTGTSAPNLAQVELLIAGIGIFQGAYNASTGQAAAGPITGTSNIALDLGDYFVVSVAGTAFFSVTLEPGDFIFANADIAANSNPSVGDYTVVQADANIAGAGATDGATQKGVAGFDSANFTVSAAGWVQLNNQSITVATYGSASKTVALAINADGITTTAAEQDIAITASQVTDFCTVVDTCMGSNSVTANIGNGTLVAYPINHNFNTRNVVVTCFRNSTPWDTVVLDVERTSVNQVTLKSTTALTTNQVSVIITKVV
jgi:hypothetical protein